MDLVLREIYESYAPLIAEAALESVAEVSPWMPWCSDAFSEATARNWILEQVTARRESTAYEFAFFDNNGSYLGGGGINYVRPDHNFANLGYWIRTSRTGNGYGTAALKALEAWARAYTALNRLEVVVAVGNTKSRRVAEKAGATRESIARSRLCLHGEYHDAVMYVFTRS